MPISLEPGNRSRDPLLSSMAAVGEIFCMVRRLDDQVWLPWSPLGCWKKKKKSPRFSLVGLVGFLKLAFSETKEVESWLGRVWGKMAMGVKMMDANTAFIQLGSNKEVAEVVVR